MLSEVMPLMDFHSTVRFHKLSIVARGPAGAHVRAPHLAWMIHEARFSALSAKRLIDPAFTPGQTSETPAARFNGLRQPGFSRRNKRLKPDSGSPLKRAGMERYVGPGVNAWPMTLWVSPLKAGSCLTWLR